MKVKIYQIDAERDLNRLAFMDYEFAMEHGWKPELYDMIFYGELEANTLDDVFTILNIGRKPENYYGHSLSVSDIVEVVKEDKSTYHYCDSFGWIAIDFEAEKTRNKVFEYEESEEEHDPCCGCSRRDDSYNCKHCRYGDDGNYSVFDVYRLDELI